MCDTRSQMRTKELQPRTPERNPGTMCSYSSRIQENVTHDSVYTRLKKKKKKHTGKWMPQTDIGRATLVEGAGTSGVSGMFCFLISELLHGSVQLVKIHRNLHIFSVCMLHSNKKCAQKRLTFHHTLPGASPHLRAASPMAITRRLPSIRAMSAR